MDKCKLRFNANTIGCIYFGRERQKRDGAQKEKEIIQCLLDEQGVFLY